MGAEITQNMNSNLAVNNKYDYLKLHPCWLLNKIGIQTFYATVTTHSNVWKNHH
jgi:hypothetical protein